MSDVKSCAEDARRLYELYAAKERLRFEVLDDYNHFSPETQKVVFDRLKEVATF